MLELKSTTSYIAEQFYSSISLDQEQWNAVAHRDIGPSFVKHLATSSIDVPCAQRDI